MGRFTWLKPNPDKPEPKRVKKRFQITNIKLQISNKSQISMSNVLNKLGKAKAENVPENIYNLQFDIWYNHHVETCY